MPEQPMPEIPVGSQRPIEFRSTSEEVAVGTVMGSLVASGGTLILGGLVGATGTSLGNFCGWPIIGGSLLVWSVFWLLPVWILMPMRPWWRFLTASAAGAAFVIVLQWHIHQRDLGTFYPWILTALPLGIVLGTFIEPIRLARGGSTEQYADQGIIIGGGFVAYGNRKALFLTAGYVIGLIADMISLGRPRVGAMVSGFLGGGLSALMFSSVVAWRGDVSVADLFFGSAWNIAGACTAVGALAGGISGWWAALIRERQQQRHQQLLGIDGPVR